jgi:hypothetical protein
MVLEAGEGGLGGVSAIAGAAPVKATPAASTGTIVAVERRMVRALLLGAFVRYALYTYLAPWEIAREG